ncbi:MAG: hypothetical protein HGB12_04035 [Bacteroidetes bacterium]|nr:hypothetical protein [Bacteroidota bacterium]
MKIIADTNIWYNLAQDKDPFSKVSEIQICPNHINIIELCKTDNVIKREELVREVIRAIFHYKNNVIYEPPFIHIAQLIHKDLEYDVVKEMGTYLEFTSSFAKGQKIEQNKREDFLDWVNLKNERFEKSTAFFNEHIKLISENVELKKQKKNLNTIPVTADFINLIIKTVTDEKYDMHELNLNEIELLLKSMDAFFKKVETSDMKIKPHDWNDMAVLGYVRPGDKYWTTDRTWINLIKEAGCQHYLYNM